MGNRLAGPGLRSDKVGVQGGGWDCPEGGGGTCVVTEHFRVSVEVVVVQIYACGRPQDTGVCTRVVPWFPCCAAVVRCGLGTLREGAVGPLYAVLVSYC